MQSRSRIQNRREPLTEHYPNTLPEFGAQRLNSGHCIRISPWRCIREIAWPDTGAVPFSNLLIDPSIIATTRRHGSLTQTRLSPSTAWLFIHIETAYPLGFHAADDNTSKTYTCEMSDQTAKKSKPMPPLGAFAKKLDSQVDRVESGASKAEQKRAQEQHEGDTTKEYGLGAKVKPMPKKARARVSGTHSKRVESLLQQYEEDMAEKEKGDSTEYSSLGDGGKRLPRKRDFQESKLSHPDEYESESWRVEGSGKNLEGPGGTGGQLGAEVTSSRPRRTPASKPDSQVGSGRVRSEGPVMGAQRPRTGNTGNSQEPTESWASRNEGDGFESFEQWDLGDDD